MPSRPGTEKEKGERSRARKRGIAQVLHTIDDLHRRLYQDSGGGRGGEIRKMTRATCPLPFSTLWLPLGKEGPGKDGALCPGMVYGLIPSSGPSTGQGGKKKGRIQGVGERQPTPRRRRHRSDRQKEKGILAKKEGKKRRDLHPRLHQASPTGILQARGSTEKCRGAT